MCEQLVGSASEAQKLDPSLIIISSLRHGEKVEKDHLVEILLNLLLAQVIGPLGAGLGERLLLGLGPVLVEPPLALLADVLRPDSLEGSHAAGSLNVADNADGDHWRSLDDGDCLDNLLLVVLGARTVHLTHNVGHASLCAIIRIMHDLIKVHFISLSI